MQLQIIPLGIQIHPVAGTLSSERSLLAHQGLPHIPGDPGRQGNYPLGGLLEPALADIGHAKSLAFRIGAGNQQSQIVITRLIHRQQAQRVGPLRVIALHHHQVDPENRLDTSGKGGFTKLDEAVEITDVSHGYSRHTQFRHP